MPKKTNTATTPSAKRAPVGKIRRAKIEIVSEPEKSVAQFTITREDIATLAFSYWERRGYQGGSPEEDWRRAEQELQSLLG